MIIPVLEYSSYDYSKHWGWNSSELWNCSTVHFFTGILLGGQQSELDTALRIYKKQ